MLLKMDTLYYWDSDKEQGFIKPGLKMSYLLAVDHFDLRGEPLTRVQFKELVDMVSNLEVSMVEEVLDANSRVLNPA
jgi:hypothetical protein